MEHHKQEYFDAVQKVYRQYPERLKKVKEYLGRDQLTATEKILYTHLIPEYMPEQIKRGPQMLRLQPDRVALQDATAQMSLLQFMQSGRKKVAVPSTIHCDHLIRAQDGAAEDLDVAMKENNEVYAFLRSAGQKYGLGFWKPGSGIIHQVVLEKYAFPGGLMIGTDSHTPNAGGLGMLAIGVGGADAAEVMAGLPWEVRSPEIVGVHLKGKLNKWASPKDVILWVCGQLTTKGGTNKIVEYFGPGARSISATGRGTITNMGAELGATTSVFQFDEKTAEYLKATDRSQVAEWAEEIKECFTADPDIEANPSKYFDYLLELDLDTLEPQVVGPHSPDRIRPLSELFNEAKQEGWPTSFSSTLIGSCTNSSYEDLERCASIARQAIAKGKKATMPLMITPGSQQVFETIKRDGQMEAFDQVGATVLANACGPCIGMWNRRDIKQGETNAILTSYNRNFPKRNDGNPETLAFIASPEVVLAMALADDMSFNPMTDNLGDSPLDPPTGPELPLKGFLVSWDGFVEPALDGSKIAIDIKPTSQRLEILEPFQAWDGNNFEKIPVLLKTWGQTTTDHISPAGKVWLPLRGHLSGISHNMYLGAVDAMTKEVKEPTVMDVCGVDRPVSPWYLEAKKLREDKGSIVVGDENFGEGSSREHAAMCPRLMGVRAVITRSFARIHETNLKKQGVLPLTFVDKSDYDNITREDSLSLLELDELAPGRLVPCIIHKADGSELTISLKHTLSTEQIGWFKAGSAMNYARQQDSNKTVGA